MEKKNNERICIITKIILFLAIVITGIHGSFWLLKNRFITSDNFVQLAITSIILGFCVVVLNNIIEFSIGGLTIKLRKAKAEAEVTIKQLRDTSIETFSALLKAAQNRPGGFGDASSWKDERVDHFLGLVQSIDKLNLRDVLTPQIEETAKVIAKDQWEALKQFNSLTEQYNSSIELPNPSQIEQSISKEALDTYRQLFELAHSSKS